MTLATILRPLRKVPVNALVLVSILSALIKHGISSINTLNEQLLPEGDRRLVSDLDASIQDTNTHHR